VVVLVVPTAAASSAGGAAIHEVGYRDEDGNMIRSNIGVGSAEDEDEDDGEDAGGAGGKQTKKKKKKRKALPSGDFVLGPGEGGGEALAVTDRSTKKAKVGGGTSTGDDDGGNNNNESSEDDFVLPDDDDAEEEAMGSTVADRLARLKAKMDRDDDDDDDDIENSVAALAREDEIAEAEDDDESRGGMIVALLPKLITRLARKLGRAEELSVWIRTVLLALISSSSGGKRMSSTERDVAARLAPLRNLLMSELRVCLICYDWRAG
jgi:hypothetical protein